MEISKDELQNIVLGNEQTGSGDQLKTAQSFLRRYAEASSPIEKQQRFKDEEAAALLDFIGKEAFYCDFPVTINNFIGEGAEQKVYRFDDNHVIKTNSGVFYECWLDYFNNLLIHNFFFPATAYTFLGFTRVDGSLQAVVKQRFIHSNSTATLTIVKEFLAYNGFLHKRNNDYFNPKLGLILEDLHDENVLSYDDILYFIDTIFYLMPSFFVV